MSSCKRVLIIDDYPLFLEAVATVVEERGIEAVTAGDGATGVELALAVAPDVIVCDYDMPGMNGLEVLAKIRSIPQTAAIPFLLVTAYADPKALREQSLACGADGFLEKQFEREELLQTLDELRRRGIGRSRATVAPSRGLP